MSKKTWVLISCLVLSLALGLSGSLAYLTDTATKVNTFTMGNVEIKVEEPTGETYSGVMPGVMVNKQAFIENTGANKAYVFMTVAVPEELSQYITLVWNEEVLATKEGYNVWYDHTKNVVTVTKPSGVDDGRFDVEDGDGKKYKYEVLAWKNALEIDEPGNKTDNLLVGVKLNEWVNVVDGVYYDMTNGAPGTRIDGLDNFKIIVTGHAIQADGLAGWEAAYDAYMGQWGNWTLDYTSGTTPDQPGIEPDPDEPGTDPDEIQVNSLATLQDELNKAAESGEEVTLKLMEEIVIPGGMIE